MRLDRKQRQRLTREANKLARETFDRDVSFERLVEIRDRLALIDVEIYSGSGDQAALERHWTFVGRDDREQ